jgi:hypothetical protein
MALLQKAYLGATPLFRNEDWFEDDKFIFLESSADVTVTANTSAHIKGAYSEIIASTTSNASLMALVVGGISANAVDTATLLDIAVGASGSETPIVQNIAVGGASSLGGGIRVNIPIPLKIASGTRLSARIQSLVTGGKTASVQIFLFDSGDFATAPTTVDAIGTNTATSEGTVLSGASGTWVQATSSTARAYRAITLVPSIIGDVQNNLTLRFETGVGPSSSEQAFGSASAIYSTTESCQTGFASFPLAGRNIPAGSRLAVQHDATANPQRYGFCLIGIP